MILKNFSKMQNILFKKADISTSFILEMVYLFFLGLIVIGIIFFFKDIAYASDKSQEEQANINNFKELILAIKNLKDDKEEIYQIFLSEDKTIYGFENGKDKISGSCYWDLWLINIPTIWGEIKKPEECKDEGCLCLCTKQWNQVTEDCKEKICEPLGKLSMLGGTGTAGKKCDFAIIKGAPEKLGIAVRNVYLSRKGDNVKICATRCS